VHCNTIRLSPNVLYVLFPGHLENCRKFDDTDGNLNAIPNNGQTFDSCTDGPELFMNEINYNDDSEGSAEFVCKAGKCEFCANIRNHPMV